MFDLMSYVNFEIGQARMKDNVVTVPINITANEEKIEEEVGKLKEILMNFRKIFGKDYALIVTEDKVKIMKEE